MNISFLSVFYPFRGGIAQFNSELYKALQKENTVRAFNFTTLYPGLLFPGTSQFVLPGEKTSAVESERVLSSINPSTYFRTAQKIRRASPELLLMAYWMPFFAPSMGTVANRLKRKMKVVSLLNNITPHESRAGDKTLNRFFLKQNHGFVVMSGTVKDDLLKIIPGAKYIFHPHPLYSHFGERADKAQSRLSLNIPQDKKVILFFGFIREYKGLDLLLEAMAKLNDEYLLVICGESYGPFDKYAEQIVRLGIKDRVLQHVRYIDEKEVPAFFSAADVCVLPYRSATQSGITSISYHFDLPVIATDAGGLKETVHHNKTGLIVDRPDAAKIAEAIKTYFAGDRQEKFRVGIGQMKKQMSWESLAGAITRFAGSL